MRSFVLFKEYGIENCLIELIEVKLCIDKNEQARLEGIILEHYNVLIKI
jgi:hypothetical protein